MDGDDEQLIARIVAALRGDAEQLRWAVDQLYKRYGPRIQRYMQRGVPRDETEALMHEVFVRVLRNGHTFREDTQRFEAWLWTIARNLLLDTLKARRVKGGETDPEIDPDDVQGDGNDPVQAVQGDELQDCFELGYDQFRAKYPSRAAALSWLVCDQLGIQDIATILGRTPGATRQYLSECRSRLKPFIEHCREHL
jgi:RNA polymerase sigma factor (sigma-70 family)